MTKFYCVDAGTEASPNKWDPFKRGDPCVGHVLLVKSTDELVFYGLNSCLGILLILDDGRRIAGHAVEIDMNHPDATPAANGQTLLAEMLQLKPADRSVKKVVFLFNSGAWDLHGLVRSLNNPPHLGINYFDDRTGEQAMQAIDATVMPDAIAVKERKGGKDWMVTRWFSQNGSIDFQ